MVFRALRRRTFWSRLRNRHPLASVLSASKLEQAFQQERARVDRNGQMFSMVVFYGSEGARPSESMVNLLKERMRVYDTIGQLDSRRVAILLPETDSDGAWTFADDAVRRLANIQMGFNCEVYSYPKDWADREGNRRRGPSSTSETWRDAPEREESSDSTGTDGPRTLQIVESQRAAAVAEAEPSLEPVRVTETRPVHDLAPVFVEPTQPIRRAIDLIVSGTAILLLSPVYLSVALLVKVTSPGPVFFVQQRAGLGGKPFPFFKFRSMYVDAERRRKEVLAQNKHKSGPIFKMENDPRITPLGRFLRRSSLDELPQLLNVFRGEMTLIGPRPPRLDEVVKYEPWQRRRLEVKGGLTCIWQVSGRSEIGFEDWVRMDIQYQEKRSFAFDAKLLLKTVGAVLSGRGAY